MNSDNENSTDLSNQGPTGTGSTPPPFPPAHMFTNARDVKISSGDYKNVIGAEIRTQGPNIDSTRTKELQEKLKATRKRYGANTDVSAFEGFSGEIHHAGTIKNVAGGKFSVVHDGKDEKNDGSEVQELSKSDPEPLQSESSTTTQSKLPPTRYEAGIFNKTQTNNLEFGDINNTAMVDFSELNLPPDVVAKTFDRIMAINDETVSGMEANIVKGGLKSKYIKVNSVENHAGSGSSYIKK
ncbi:hypothetical protein BDQ17DRAFT_1434262 [Cyathus striatus]|nr:hypothetical protein BDQ17DRAFT_1434262 [Cyathus striatus]